MYKYKLDIQQRQLISSMKKREFSQGELRIANFLKENLVRFKPNYWFWGLTVNRRPKLLFFDFYLPDYNLCIEFDGKQHFTYRYMGKKQVNLEKNDFMKNVYCMKNNIHLLRIKYTDFDNIETLICKKFDQIA